MKILEILGTGTVGTPQAISAESVLTDLSNAFAEAGHEVTLAETPSRNERSLLHEGVELVEVACPNPHMPCENDDLLKKFGRLGRKLDRMLEFPFRQEMKRHARFVRELAQKVSFDDFDIVHFHHGKQAHEYRNLTDKDYFYTSHWDFEPGDPSPHARTELQILEGAKRVISLGRHVTDFAPSADATIIQHGIDLSKWKSIPREEARSLLGIPSDTFLAVQFSYITHYKGVDVLVEACKELSRKIPNFRAIAAGRRGTHRDHDEPFSEYAQEVMAAGREANVEFPGYVPYASEQHRALLSAADVFVLPSRNEAQGLAALEALTLGTPVVASRLGGLREMVTPEVGRLFPVGQADELAKTILHLAENPAELAQLRRNCLPYVTKKYSWPAVADRYLATFKEAA